MSLDVYLTMPPDDQRIAESRSRIFIRDCGSTVEISREEWDRRFPGQEPFAVMMDEAEPIECFSANITHNLAKMAYEAGIYLACWKPGEMLDPDTATKINEQSKAKNYHGPGGVCELEKTLPKVHARDLIEPLRKGLALLRSDPKRFEKFNAPNGWGLYEHFVPWVANYLSACEEYPDADVGVSR